MEKVARGTVKPEPVAVPDEFVLRVDSAVSLKELDALWEDAKLKGYSATLQPMFTKIKKAVL